MIKVSDTQQNLGSTALWFGLLAMLSIFMIPAAHAVTPMVAAGGVTSLALKSDGTVWAWGLNSNIPVQVLIGSVAVVAGGGHYLALKSGGTLWAWGSNSDGQLGLGDAQFRQSPIQVPISGVVAIAAGDYYSHALKSNGTLWAWGGNSLGQLGTGTNNDQLSPIQVPISSVETVVADDSHTFALKNDGTLWAWGYNENGELGLGCGVNHGKYNCPCPYSTCLPYQALVSGVAKVAAGITHTLALKIDGTLWAWGSNSFGELGINDPSVSIKYYPVQVPINGVIAVAAGWGHSIALKSDGTLWAWGDNRYGELGLGDTVARYSPARVPINGVAAVAARHSHTLALKSDGTVWVWGLNTSGQLGLGDRMERHSPTQIPNFNLGTGDAATTLTVSVAGSGTVYSTPGGINCGSDCTQSYTKGTSVMLTAMAASGYVFDGWSGACLGVTTDYCTLTMDTNKSVAAVFKTKTPEKEQPRPRFQGVPGGGCTAPTGRNAVVITHGWNAKATEWVYGMATEICKLEAPGATLFPLYPNAISPSCSGTQWDVWMIDWRDMASSPWSWTAYANAYSVGTALADTLYSCGYKHIHLIAHSAGSNIIQTATNQLKGKKPTPAIHETFLDAYDPFAESSNSFPGRHVSDDYGKNANWADNYVDARDLVGISDDKTDLHLSNGYNINVTPADDGCNDIRDIDIFCRHSRPWRFYGKSISTNFLAKHDYNIHDPIISTAGTGYPLSVEQGKILGNLSQQYQKNKECYIYGSSCQDTPPPPPANKVYIAANASGAVVDRSGSAQCVVGALVIPCSQIGLTTGAATSAALAESPEAQAADAPTRAPAWLAMQIQTTQPTNTLRFSYRFAAGGEGLLRVFVNENTVREIDQRYVSIASTELESVYVGDLAPGTYKIAFRLDGYGATTSGVTLTGIGLSQQKLVVGIPLAVTKSGTGSGTVTSNPAGINCGTICAAGFTGGANVTLTATAAAGSKFTGWGGACAGTTPTCTVAMSAAKSVTATFTRLPVLTVTKSGSGAGLITGTGINCGVDCTESYNLNTIVTLTATAYGGSTFTGWSGACTGTGACTVSMTASKTVTATFNTTTAGKTALTLYKSGAGLGTVASSPAGINCGTACGAGIAYFTTGATVTLTATTAAGSTFTGWGGACAGTVPTCTLPMSAARVVTATFTRPMLAVAKAGSGSGVITGTGINCGVDCTESYNLNTIVTLTAAPAAGSTFVGWSGACTGTGACTVSMTASKTVTATFNTTTAGTYALTLYKIGAGLGTVASNPAGINCGAACVANFTSGRLVTLTATAAAGSTFTGWGGACAGTTPTCTVTMSAARIVTANFTRPVLTVTKAGSGTVTSNPAGINCGADCSEAYNLNTSVALTATTTTGWQFAGWTGACTGTGACAVSMNATKTVTATFKPKLTVTKVGSGTVTSSPAGINCGTTCAAYFPFNGTVTLTAAPAAGQKLKSWAGCTTASGNTCTVGMAAAKTVTATFGL